MRSSLNNFWLLSGSKALLPAALTLCLLDPRAAQCGIASISGNVEIVPTPASVRRNVFESSASVRVFAERFITNVPSVLINATQPGLYDDYADFQDETIPNPPAFESYFLHFDPIGNTQADVSGTVTFESPILGVIGRGLTLEETDSTLGFPTTLYPTDRFDREPNFNGNYSYFTLSADRRSVFFQLRVTEIDQLRILATLPGGVSASHPVVVTSAAFVAGQGFTMLISGIPGTHFSIGVTEDLSVSPDLWSEVGSGIVGATPFSFTDAQALFREKAFYIVVPIGG